ncbi:MAG: helix-turn-helix transcriptional regulator, partial [Clostridia bacterium]|nr:helix-turn-helix transcriptional regulator [Clostridia bacterium]
MCYYIITPVINTISTQQGGVNMQLNLGNNIRQYRRKDKRTQEQLAEVLGVTAQAVSRW